MRKFLFCFWRGAVDLIQGILCGVALTMNFYTIIAGISKGEAWAVVLSCALLPLLAFSVYLRGLDVLQTSAVKIAPGKIVFSTDGTAWRIRWIRLDTHLLTFECEEITDSNVVMTNIFDINDLGKTLFLTAKEAAAAREAKKE